MIKTKYILKNELIFLFKSFNKKLFSFTFNLKAKVSQSKTKENHEDLLLQKLYSS